MNSEKGVEKRDCVRASFSVDVRFSILEADEYVALKKRGDVSKKGIWTRYCLRPLQEDEGMGSKGVDPHLLEFLIQIEDKLDRILDLLAKNQLGEKPIYVGQGIDICGGGMRMYCTTEVSPGQVLNTEFRVFRYPSVTLRVYCKVVRIFEVEKGGERGFEVALEFLDLDESEKDWIISCVFQIQRLTIRKKRNH